MQMCRCVFFRTPGMLRNVELKIRAGCFLCLFLKPPKYHEAVYSISNCLKLKKKKQQSVITVITVISPNKRSHYFPFNIFTSCLLVQTIFQLHSHMKSPHLMALTQLWYAKGVTTVGPELITQMEVTIYP